MTTPFRLLSLPSAALKHVLQFLDFNEIVACSVLSKRINVPSLCAGAHEFLIKIKKNCLHLEALLGSRKAFVFNLDDRIQHLEVKTPRNGELVRWSKMGLSTGEWISRILHVTKNQPIFTLYIGHAPKSDVNFRLLFSALSDIRVVSVGAEESQTNAFVQNILDVILPKTRTLSIFSVRYNMSKEEFQKIIIQNLAYFDLRCDELDFQLDDLLITNAIKIKVTGADLSDKDINRFFKHWKALKSNPRMEHLTLIMHRRHNRENILKGLRAFELPEYEIIDFEPTEYAQLWNQEVTGGFQITRTDGTNGRIVFKETNMEGELQIDFFVFS